MASEVGRALPSWNQPQEFLQLHPLYCGSRRAPNSGWGIHLVEHAASRTSNTAGMCPGLQVDTQQALSPMAHLMHDAWTHGKVDRILEPLQQASSPLSNSSFETALPISEQTWQSNTPPERLKNWPSMQTAKLGKDHWDAQQTFKGCFRVPKTEEVMQLFNVSSEDDLLETL